MGGFAAIVSAGSLFVVMPAGGLTTSQLHSKALSLSNMPAGWAVDNSSSGGGISSGCLAGLKRPPGTDTKVSVAYKDGQLPEFLELLASGKRALPAYKELSHVLARCRRFTASGNGQTYNYTVGAMSFPQVGNDSSAYSITFSVQGVSGAIYLVLFQVGSIVGAVGYGDIGRPDTSQFQAFVTEAIDKIEGKPVTVPTTY